MNKERAIELVLKRYRNTTLLKRLMTYDEKKTVTENAVELGMPASVIRNFILRYGLKFKQAPYFVRGRVYKREKSNQYLSVWDSNLSLKDNANKLGVGQSVASTIANNHGLSYTKNYKHGLKIKVAAKARMNELRSQVVELRDKGMTLQQIANVYGLTRERIRQILL